VIVIGRRFITLLVFALGAILPASAAASTITLAGVGSGAYSTGTAVVEFNAQTNTLTFTLTNTSAITQPGSTSTITGVGFDLLPIGNASSSGLNGFTGLQAPSLSSTFTFGDGALGNVPQGFNSVVLDFGFLTGPNFTGGQTSLGLLPGESASFVVSAAAFAGFTESGIANSMFVRFQNVPEITGSTGDVGTVGATPVPEPSSVVLLGLGIAGMAGVVRRRMRANRARGERLDQ
jgi:hypothetical protein